jgi:hypothetical protein
MNDSSLDVVSTQRNCVLHGQSVTKYLAGGNISSYAYFLVSSHSEPEVCVAYEIEWR